MSNILGDILYCLNNTPTIRVKLRRGQDVSGDEYSIIQGNTVLYKIYPSQNNISISKFPGGGYQNENFVEHSNNADVKSIMRKLQQRTHPSCFHKIVQNWNNFRTNIADINMIETALIDKNTRVVNSGNVYGIHFDLPEIPNCKMTINFRQKWAEFGFGGQQKIAMLNRGYMGLKLRVLQNSLNKAVVR